MATLFTKIPIIDLSQADDNSARPEVLKSLRDALIEVGFLYVSNHGVSMTVVDNLVNALPTLFKLEDAVKSTVALENSPHFLGYSGVGSENTGGKVDRREQFEFATELRATWRPGVPLYERLRGPNQVGLQLRGQA